MPLDLEQRQLLNKARLLGPQTALPVTLGDAELARLIAVILNDVGRSDIAPESLRPPPGEAWDYYSMPLTWFVDDVPNLNFDVFYEACLRSVQDFQTYFRCVCELHKRRRKYALILEAQPLPTSLQVAPRALLEFGTLDPSALATWLTWRKWFYDIDNRAAQETGYLFEPILANALGGAPVGARGSPVRRRKDQAKGRQVDCIVGRDAYEFKLRVTIAASGQGRFGEEIDFAEDCVGSGLRPILLVLDPTPSARLDDLIAAYRTVGGQAHIGDDAWRHIEERSGPIMATFVERYVRRPISAMDEHMVELLDFSIGPSADRRQFRVQVGDEHVWLINRRENAALADDDDEE
jgi:hypothetical protein